jgi:hypothetical protein
MKPKVVSDVMMAFPANVIPDYLPPSMEIPDEFWQYDDSWTNELFQDWFYGGLKDPKFYPKPGIDAEMAYRHIRAVMGSFQPKHEHKVAGCRYMLDTWFEKVEWERAK